jgi:hypothetical protein
VKKGGKNGEGNGVLWWFGLMMDEDEDDDHL